MTRFFGVVFSILLTATAVRADEEDEPPKQAPDPNAISGAFIAYHPRPEDRGRGACSAKVPVCVHGSGPGLLPALDAFERAWQTLTGALALPSPDLDPGTLAYDVFLGDESATLPEARDVRSRVDRVRAFTKIDRRAKAGCQLDAIAAESIARASIYRAAPATDEGTALAQSRSLAELAVPCATAYSADAIRYFQGRRQRALPDVHVGNDNAGPNFSPNDPLFAKGGSAFWTRLDWAYGRTPGGITTATWALSPTMTAVGALRWQNEPDTFDVLRATFKGALSTKSTVHDLWLDWGVARAFFGDAYHLPELRTLGEEGKITPDWEIDWPSKPRRLAGTPIYPTGAAYVLITAKPKARLRVEIDWEEHALFRWTFVKLDASGREKGRIPIPTTERATQALMTLVDTDADKIMLVGVNVGDPQYPFDPDDGVWEPHSWIATVAEEP